MDMTNTMKAWLITNGACNSFAARVGLYRAKYAVTTPLIGISNISAWHMKEQQLREDGAAAPAGGDAHGESGRSLTGHFGQRGWMRFVGSCLDPHHSHFLLAANADRQGRQQTKLRSDFEACVRRGKGWAGLRDYIHRTLREHDLTWTDSGPDLASAAGGIEYSKSDAEGSTAQGAAGSSADAPVVMVCVQGDHAVIRTMLTHTVHEALPVLLVRGTGRATDLVADCVCLKFPQAHSMSFQRVGARQGLLPQQVVLRDYVDAMRSRLQQVFAPSLDRADRSIYRSIDRLMCTRALARSRAHARTRTHPHPHVPGPAFAADLCRYRCAPRGQSARNRSTAPAVCRHYPAAQTHSCAGRGHPGRGGEGVSCRARGVPAGSRRGAGGASRNAPRLNRRQNAFLLGLRRCRRGRARGDCAYDCFGRAWRRGSEACNCDCRGAGTGNRFPWSALALPGKRVGARPRHAHARSFSCMRPG